MPGAPAPVTAAVQWAVELEQAVAMALQAWLASAPAGLGAVAATNQPAISVFGDWIEGDVTATFPRAVILRTGEPDILELDPQPLADIPPVFVSGNTWNYTWIVGEGTQNLDMEVWATNKPMRGDTLARLRAALKASVDVTLAAYIAAQPPGTIPAHDPVSNEILLQLAAPYATTIASYYFEKPRLFEAPNAVGEREWRASFSGEAHYDITVVAPSAALASIQLQAQIAQDPAFSQNGGGTYNANVTAASATSSKGAYSRG
jgi:hypothetical protein